MNKIKQHHRLLALLLSVLLLVGMIPMSVLSASAAEVDAVETGANKVTFNNPVSGYTNSDDEFQNIDDFEITTTPDTGDTNVVWQRWSGATTEAPSRSWSYSDGVFIAGDKSLGGVTRYVLRVLIKKDGVLKFNYRVNSVVGTNGFGYKYFSSYDSIKNSEASKVCIANSYNTNYPDDALDNYSYYRIIENGTSYALDSYDFSNAGLCGFSGDDEWQSFCKPVVNGSVYYLVFFAPNNSSYVNYIDNKAWVKNIEIEDRGTASTSTFYYDATKGNVSTSAISAYSAPVDANSPIQSVTVSGNVGEKAKLFVRRTNLTSVHANSGQFLFAQVYRADEDNKPIGNPINTIAIKNATTSRIIEPIYEDLAGNSTNKYYIDFTDYGPVKNDGNVPTTSNYTVLTRPNGLQATTAPGTYYQDWEYDNGSYKLNLEGKQGHAIKAYLEIIPSCAGTLSFTYRVNLASSSCWLNYGTRTISQADNTTGIVKTAGDSGEVTISNQSVNSNQVYRIGFSQAKNSANYSTAVISNITFTPLVETKINYFAENNGKFVKTDGLNSAGVSYETDNAGNTTTVYVVPDYENGYKLTGVYDSNDALVEPVKEDYSSLGLGVFYYPRRYEFTFPQSGSLTYTAKFEKMTKQTFDVKLPEGISYVMLTQNRAYADTLTPLTISNALPLLLEDGDTFQAYPGDRFEVSMIMDSEHLIKGYKAFSDTVTQISPRYDATKNYTFNVTANSTGGTLELLTDAMPAYEPVEDYTDPANVTVTTRGSDSWEHKTGVNSNVIFTHPWTADANGVLTSGTASTGYDYSFLSIVADRDGQLSFDYRISTNTGNFMLYKVGHSDPDLYTGKADNYSTRADYCGEVDWTTYSATVSAGDEIRILYYRSSSSTPIGDDCVQIKGIQLLYDANVTFDSNDFTLGSINYQYMEAGNEDPVSVTGLSAETAAVFAGGSEVTVTAYPTADGQFVRWEDEDGNKLSTSAVYTFNATRNMTVKAIFTDACDAEDAIVAINNTVLYGDFDQAIDEAVQGDYIVLLQDFEIDHDVTIPTGVTLLVPFDDAHHLYTTHLQGHPALAQGETPDDYNCEYAGGGSYTVPGSYDCYCKLTVADGVTVTVNGSISLSAKNVAAFNNNDKVCPVDRYYSQLDLAGDSQLVLKNGSNLYAWGYLTGTGSVVAESGSSVYEYFQIYDFRGGTISANLYLDSSNQFPFNQYYIQNIEAKIKYEYGSTEYVNTAVYASNQITVAGGIVFIGQNSGENSKGLFQLSEGSWLERTYDPVHDKMSYVLHGNTKLDAIKLTVMGITLSSSDFYLPITNIDITVSSGGTLSTSSDVILLPGSSLNIENNAALNINGGAEVVIAGVGVGMYSGTGSTLRYPARAIPFAASEGWTPRITKSAYAADPITAAQTYCTAHPAALNNNGTVNVANGAALVCTEDGAQIDSSTGNGVFNFNGESATVELERFVRLDSTGQSEREIYETVNTPSALLRDNTSDDFSTEGARWDDDINAHYTKKNGEWGDWREVNYVGSNDYLPLFTPVLGTQLVNVTDKDSITDYNALVDAKADFDTDGKYWKYVEKGKWTYDEDPIMDLMDPSVSHLVAYPVLESTSIFEKHSLTLNGDVGVNFYVFDAPAGATMSYSWGNKYISDNNYSADESYTAVDDTIIDDPNGTGYKVASVSVAPKEIGDDITVKMMLDGNVISTETYSAADYLNTIINDDAKALAVCENNSAKAEALQALCTSMLQYGAACQNQFGYKTGNLVSDSYEFVSPDLSGLTSSYETDYPAAGNGSVPGFTFMGYTMTLNSETVLDLVFKNESSDEYPAFTVTGATPVRLSEGKYYMFDVTDIKINELLNNRTVTINDQNMTVNAGTYIYKAITTQQSNDTLMATMNNLYNYYLNATAFFALA